MLFIIVALLVYIRILKDRIEVMESAIKSADDFLSHRG
jgi:hypothetical protein